MGSDTRDSAPSNGVGAPGTEIEVTHEMIEAGLKAYRSFTIDEREDEAEKVVTEVLRRSVEYMGR